MHHKVHVGNTDTRQKVYKCIQNVYITKPTQATIQKCTKMSTFCIHFSSQCILQNVYFINVHKVYNVMYTSIF